ncbi:MAG: hypothetical protein R3C56_30240 [Pirellulaceae bacterium]
MQPAQRAGQAIADAAAGESVFVVVASGTGDVSDALDHANFFVVGFDTSKVAGQMLTVAAAATNASLATAAAENESIAVAIADDQSDSTAVASNHSVASALKAKAGAGLPQQPTTTRPRAPCCEQFRCSLWRRKVPQQKPRGKRIKCHRYCQGDIECDFRIFPRIR